MHAFIAVALLLLAAAPAAAEEGCLTGPCHREHGRETNVHEPVRYGDCRLCHKGSASGHPEGEGSEFDLAFGGGAALCFSCHGGVKEEVARAAVVHGPAAEGGCLPCHHPHASEERKLLRGAFPADSREGNPERRPFEAGDYSLCWTCHDVYAVVMEKTASRTRFREGGSNLHYRHVVGERGYTCLACHSPHASRGARLVERPSGWSEDLVNFTAAGGGGSCAPVCHVPRTYRRGAEPGAGP